MERKTNNKIDTTLYNEKSLYLLNIRELRDIGRKFGVPSPTTMKKQDLIEYILKVVYGEIAPTRSNYGRPNVRDFEIDKYIDKIKKNSDLTDELLKIKLDDYSVLDELKVASPKEKPIANNIETKVFVEEDGKYYLKKHAFVASDNDFEIDKNLVEKLSLVDYDVVEARIEGEFFKIITVNGNRINDKFANFVINDHILEAGKHKTFDVSSIAEKESIEKQIHKICEARALKLVVFSKKKCTNWCTECVEYDLNAEPSVIYKNFVKFIGICEKLVYNKEDIVIMIDDISLIDEVLDSFDEDVAERAKANTKEKIDTFLALENLLVTFTVQEEKVF